MMSFFASLRFMIAADKMTKVLGDIAIDVINKTFLPELKGELGHVKTDSDRDRIEDLILQYERYADPRSQESKEFSEIAERVMNNTISRYSLGGEDREDILTDLAADFYLSGSRSGRTLMHSLEGHDVKRGPLDYTKLWSTVIRERSNWIVREMARKTNRNVVEDDEGKRVVERLPDNRGDIGRNVEISDEDLKELMERMIPWVRSRARDDVMKSLFDQWMDVAEKGGADALFGQRKIEELLFKPVMEKYDVSRSGLGERMKDLQKLVIGFLEKEVGVRVTDALKKKFRVGSVEIVAYDEFRRRFAAWILGVSVPR